MVRRNQVSKQNLESIVEFLGPLGNTQLKPLNLPKKKKKKKKGTRCPERVKAGLNAHSEAASG